MEDLRIDASQIVATYESLKGTQTLGDPSATAAELSQRFGAEVAESWIESVNPSRPGYERDRRGDIGHFTGDASRERPSAHRNYGAWVASPTLVISSCCNTSSTPTMPW